MSTSDIFNNMLGLLGGLGLFMFGMTLMGSGLQKAAGARMRSILEAFTKNKILGCLVGIVFTGVIQSSSAATVIVVSFVNAELMNLSQAIGIIFGANIGTTVTAQLMAFNLTRVAPLILMGGIILYMFIKKPMANKVGEILIGFGILFIGMSTMSSSVGVLKNSPEFSDLLTSLNNPVVGVLVGTVATAIVQSSSATVGILMVLASQGLIDLQMCFFIILGCNIGACVSAVLASLGGNNNAKRAALLHLLINVIGTVIFFAIILFAGDYVQWAIEKLTSHSTASQEEILMKNVANTHMLFKIVQVIMLMPFSELIIKLAYLIIPDKGDEQEAEAQMTLKYIGEHTVYSPATAIPQVVLETERMGSFAIENLNRAMEGLLYGDQTKVEKVYEVEKTIDYLNTEITNYLVKVNQLRLPLGDKKMLGALFHVVNDFERIGDHAENIADFASTKIRDRFQFSNTAAEELRTMQATVNKLLELSLEMFSNADVNNLESIKELENRTDEMERRLLKNHISRMMYDMCDPQAGMVFTDIVSNLERAADHGTNVAFSIFEKDPETSDDTTLIEKRPIIRAAYRRSNV